MALINRRQGLIRLRNVKEGKSNFNIIYSQHFIIDFSYLFTINWRCIKCIWWNFTKALSYTFRRLCAHPSSGEKWICFPLKFPNKMQNRTATTMIIIIIMVINSSWVIIPSLPPCFMGKALKCQLVQDFGCSWNTKLQLAIRGNNEISASKHYSFFACPFRLQVALLRISFDAWHIDGHWLLKSSKGGFSHRHIWFTISRKLPQTVIATKWTTVTHKDKMPWDSLGLQNVIEISRFILIPMKKSSL